jgi:Transglutaminase-like superfamily
LSVVRTNVRRMADNEFWAEQGPVTEPGEFASLAREVPGSVTAMRAAARGLVFHYRADGDFTANGISADRITEIDTRYARDMLGRLVSLADQPLAEPRTPSQRLVGCCRDFTVLFLSIAREHGIPARARVGFATYFHPGRYIDHVVAEIWDAAASRWRLVDPELADDHVSSVDGARVDPEDLTSAQFLTGPAAWLACRSGAADAERFAVDPDLDIPATRGWPYVRHNLIHDLAALTKHEMLLWDNWGWTEMDSEPSPEQLAALDDLAAAASTSDVPLATIKSFYERNGLAVPATVTSYSPAAEVPLQVSV